MPIFSPALALVLVVLAGVVAGADEFVAPGAAILRFVSDLAQASTRRPVNRHNIKRRDFDILFSDLQDDRARR